MKLWRSYLDPCWLILEPQWFPLEPWRLTLTTVKLTLESVGTSIVMSSVAKPKLFVSVPVPTFKKFLLWLWLRFQLCGY